MSKKILIVLTSHSQLGDTGKPTGAYLPEISHPYEVFQKVGFSVDFASVKGGKVPVYGDDRKDVVNAAFLDNQAVMAQMHQSLSPREIDASEYDAIFFAGGHGTMWDFPQEETLADVAASLYERGKVVAAVCHGPAALVNIMLSNGKPLVSGKTVAAFTNEEEKAVGLEKVVPFFLHETLAAKGATLTSAPNWASHVEVSERLVTGQNPASAKGVAEAIVKLLL